MKPVRFLRRPLSLLETKRLAPKRAVNELVVTMQGCKAFTLPLIGWTSASVLQTPCWPTPKQGVISMLRFRWRVPTTQSTFSAGIRGFICDWTGFWGLFASGSWVQVLRVLHDIHSHSTWLKSFRVFLFIFLALQMIKGFCSWQAILYILFLPWILRECTVFYGIYAIPTLRVKYQILKMGALSL